jgi:hypothetical protein
LHGGRAHGVTGGRVIPGVIALPRGVEDPGARDADRATDAGAAHRHMGAADADRQARPGSREVHRQTGAEVRAAVEAEPHPRIVRQAAAWSPEGGPHAPTTSAVDQRRPRFKRVPVARALGPPRSMNSASALQRLAEWREIRDAGMPEIERL